MLPDPSVERVYLNQGINKVLGIKKGDPGYISPNRRPDVTIVKKDGTIHQREVPSASDDPYKLRQRMDDTNSKLPELMRGEDFLTYITKTSK